MHVPQHISVTGDEVTKSNYDDSEYRVWTERQRVLSMMEVPEKLTVASGDMRNIRPWNEPKEVMMEQMMNAVKESGPVLKDLPMKITLDKEEYEHHEPAHLHEKMSSPISVQEESMSQASIAIEENPLQELKLMRRQLTKVCNRLYLLEDDLETRRRKDFWLGSGMIGMAAVIIFLILKR